MGHSIGARITFILDKIAMFPTNEKVDIDVPVIPQRNPTCFNTVALDIWAQLVIFDASLDALDAGLQKLSSL